MQADRDRSATGLLARLSRKTSSGRFLPEIDGLRFFAILLVVLFHISAFLSTNDPSDFSPGSLLARIADQGSVGVQLFFVISGFILAGPFIEWRQSGGARVSLHRYYTRRLTRLEPPYIVALTLIGAAYVIFRGESLSGLMPHYLAGVTYSHGVAFNTLNPIDDVIWSLEVEVQFYVLVPFLASVFMIDRASARRGLLLVAASLAIVAQVTMIPDGSVLRLTLLNYIQFFLLGFLVADLFTLEWKGQPAEDRLWDAIWLGVWGALFLSLLGGWLTELVVPAACALIVAGGLRGSSVRSLLRVPWLFTIGGMCYSIYLIHHPLIGFVGPFTRHIPLTGLYLVDLAVQSSALLVPILIASAAFFVVIERPCMDKDWPSKLATRLRGGGQVASPSPAPPGPSLD
jgi:peptidoglycan/LPS O-acetylase OafA/YrhL